MQVIFVKTVTLSVYGYLISKYAGFLKLLIAILNNKKYTILRYAIFKHLHFHFTYL